MAADVRVYISPQISGEDRADGGIRRVVEAQHRWLPQYGVELVSDPAAADVLALHAGAYFDNMPDKPTVAHCHGLYWEGYEWENWALQLNKDVILTLKYADEVTATSEWVAQALRRGMWSRVHTLYHGINPDDWTPLETSNQGMVLWNKTRVDAICDPKPVNELAALAPDVPFMTTYGHKASNVLVTGTMPYLEAKNAVQAARVYMATARETFGIGTLEAMVCGVPILGWRWGGQAEFVHHKKHGYLAEPNNYDDLLAGLRFCLENRDELGQAAREYVLENFTWEQRMKPYAELYKSLHERASRPHPKTSVIITYYNLGRYLLNAVESCHEAGEVVIVDDASPEPVPSAVEALAASDPRIKIIHNDTNMYLSEALNTGISASSGDYIVPLDADNLLAPGAIGVLEGELDKRRDIDIAYGKMAVFYDNDDGGSRKPFVSDWPPQDAVLEFQLTHRNQITSTAMYRRRVWERVGGYRQRCRTAEDADFWSRALSLGFTGKRVTDAVTLFYRDRDDSMSHVQTDWAWHDWYDWARNPATGSFLAGGAIPTHEFPVVSVVIPVGPKHARLVLDALDSVQNQTFKRWEAVVVNNTGSPLPWVHPWARVVNSKRGAASARNAGVNAAKGVYTLFLDADDYLHPRALEIMVQVMDEAGGFVYSDWFVGETQERKYAPEFDPKAVLRELPYPVTCMYRTQDLRDNKIRFDKSFDGKGWEDWDFQLQVVAEHGICGTRIPAPLFHYRLSTGELRVSAFDNQNERKAEIYAKWADYIEGRKENMASGCGCGGGSFAGLGAGPDAPTTQAAISEQPTVQLEYLSTDSGARSFLGRVTGNRYKFDTEGDMRVRRVFQSDAEALVATGWFRLVPESSFKDAVDLTPLQASGPPQLQQVAA